MKRNERKKHVPALVLMLLILCALLIGAEATTIPDKTALPNAQEIVTNLRIIRNASMENGDIPQENNGWMGGDPSCEHLHISWVSDGNLRHHAVCDDCGAESPERAHTAQCFFKTNLTHRMECNLCRQALGEEKPHIIRYLSDGVKEHTIVCDLCGMAISEPHKLVCVNDDEKGHHWQCTDCGEITATDSHRLIPRYVSDGHCFACKDCSYISDVEPCTYVAVSQGEKGHVWKCSVCSATTGNVEPHHLKWIGDGLTGHHEECLDCGYAAPKVLHDWVAVSRGLKGHGLECPTCGEVTEQMESHTWVGVSRGPKNHVLKCSECGETTSQTEAHYWTVVQNGVTGHSLECVVCGETSEQTPHDWTLVNEGQAGHRGVCETCQYTTQLLPHMLRSTEDGVSCACGYRKSNPSKPEQGNEPVLVEIPGSGKSEETGGDVAGKPEGQKTGSDDQLSQLEEKIRNYSEKEKEILHQVEDVYRQFDNGEIGVNDAASKLGEIIRNKDGQAVYDDYHQLKDLKEAAENKQSGGDVAEKPEGLKIGSDDQLSQLEEKIRNYSEKEKEILHQVEEVYRQFDNGEIGVNDAASKLGEIIRTKDGQAVYDDYHQLKDLKEAAENKQSGGDVAEKPEGQPKQEGEAPSSAELKEVEERVSNYSEKEAELLRQFEEVYKQFDNGEISHEEAVKKLDAIRNSDKSGEKVFDDSQVLRWKSTGETGDVAVKPESLPSETTVDDIVVPSPELAPASDSKTELEMSMAGPLAPNIDPNPTTELEMSVAGPLAPNIDPNPTTELEMSVAGPLAPNIDPNPTTELEMSVAGPLEHEPVTEQEQNGKTGSGKETIGETPYIFDLKKVTGEDTDGGETLKDGESVTIGIRNDQSAKVLIQAEKDGTSITGLESLMLDVTDVSKLFIETEGEKTGAVDSQDAGSSAETEFTEEQGGTTVLEPGMKYAWSKSSGDQDAAYQMTISRNEGQTEVDYRRIRKSYKIAVKAQKKARMKVKESKTVLKPESVVEKDGKTVYGLEQKSKRKLSTRRSRTKRLKEISDKIVPYSQVYIQENRASGR